MTLFNMHNMTDDERQLDVIIMLSEYTNLNDRSRRLDLLLKLAQFIESISLKYEIIHINITVQNVKKTLYGGILGGSRSVQENPLFFIFSSWVFGNP